MNLKMQIIRFTIYIRKFLLSHTRHHYVKVFLNHKMYLHNTGRVSKLLRNTGIFEEIETKFVMNEIKDGDFVLDLGANIGYYTLIFAKLVGNNGKVFSFEPEQANFNLLLKNVKENNYNNVILENIAISNNTGTATLYLSNGRPGSHTIFPTSFSIYRKKVKMIKLDDYFANSSFKNKISFIKMDIEGSELNAMEGLISILKINKKIKLLIEFNPKLITQNRLDSEDLLNLLKNLGFKISYFDKDTQKIKAVEDTDIFLNMFDTVEEKKLIKYTNLICY